MTSNGQTIAHIAQEMHLRSSIRTTSLAATREMAPLGQTIWQGAGSQCRHLFG